MKPMVPSARERIDAIYDAWNDITDVSTDIEDLHIAAMDQAYRDGFAACLAMLENPPLEMMAYITPHKPTDVVARAILGAAERWMRERAAAEAIDSGEG